MKKIDYVNALPGSGKTFAIKKNVRKGYWQAEKYIIAVPTKMLMDEIDKGLVAVPHACIKSEENAGNGENVVDKLNQALDEEHRVILISHEALKRFPESMFKRLAEFNLIIDEVFSIANFEMYNLKNSLQQGCVLNRIVEMKGVGEIKELRIKDRSEYNNFISEEHYDDKEAIELESTKNLLRRIKDKTKVVLACELKHSKIGNYCVATLFNLNMLTHFKSITIMSAFIEYTILFHVLKKQFGFEMVDITHTLNLWNLDHRYKRLVLYPLLAKNLYSKTFRKKSRFVEIDQLEEMREFHKTNNTHHKATLGIQQFVTKVMKTCSVFDGNTLRVKNKDDSVSAGIVISSRSHGQNSFDHAMSIVHIAAFNSYSYVRAFLKKWLGEDYDVWLDNNVLTTVQNIMRTNIRVRNSKKPVSALVADYETAKQIRKLLNGYPKIKKHCLYGDFGVYSEEPKKVELPDDYDIKTHKTNGQLRRTEAEKRKQAAERQRRRRERIKLKSAQPNTNGLKPLKNGDQ